MPKHGGKGQQDREGNAGHPQKRDVRGSVHVSGTVEALLPPALVNEYKSANKETDGREEKRFVIERFTLLFVAIVAVLNLIQTCASVKSASSARDAYDLAKRNFVAEQRPYVASPAAIFPFIAAGRIGDSVAYTNYGKSAALHVRSVGTILVGNDADAQAERWFARQAKRTEDIPIKRTPEGIPLPQPSERIVMPPNDPADAIVTSATEETSTTSYFLVVVRVTYKDISLNNYWTDICWQHLAGENLSLLRCPIHGSIN